MKMQQLKLFNNKNCRIILDNGFTYQGQLKGITKESITFYDRFSGLMIIELDSVKAIFEIRDGGRENEK